MINGYRNITNQHNHVGADIIRPRNPHNLIAVHFVGCGDLDAPLPRERHKIFVKAYFADRRGKLCSPFKNPHKF